MANSKEIQPNKKGVILKVYSFKADPKIVEKARKKIDTTLSYFISSVLEKLSEKEDKPKVRVVTKSYKRF